MNYDLTKVIVNPDGSVQTGIGTTVNKNNLSDAGYQMALNYASKKQPSTQNTSTTNNAPVSSATPIINQNTNTSTSTALDTVNGVKKPLSTYQSRAVSELGIPEEDARNYDPLQLATFFMGQDQAQKSADEAKQTQKQMYDAALAGQNAAYKSASEEINRQRDADLGQAKTTAAQLNPYSGANTDENNYNTQINGAYDRLQNQLTLQAQQAKAALDAGNFQAYAEINNQLAQTKQTGLANISNMVSQLQDRKLKQDQFNMQQKNVWADNFLNQLSKINYTPEQITSMQKNGLLQNDPTYMAGISAGFSPEGVMQAMQSGSIAQANLKNKQDQLLVAQIRAANSQAMIGTWSLQTTPEGALVRMNSKTGEIQPVDYTSATGSFGGSVVPKNASDAFLQGISNISVGGNVNKEEKATVYSTINKQLSNGNIDGAKDSLKSFVINGLPTTDQGILSGINTVKYGLASIKNQIQNLPDNAKTGFISGNWEKALERLGTTDSAKAAGLRSEIEALKKTYINQISGKQFSDKELVSYGITFPDISNDTELNISKIDGFLKVADLAEGVIMRSKLGGVYDTIYGGKTSAPSSGKTSSGLGYTLE